MSLQIIDIYLCLKTFVCVLSGTSCTMLYRFICDNVFDKGKNKGKKFLKENSYMDEKCTQAYIYELLEKAKKVDSEYKVFGSDKHKYRLNPPVSLDEVLTLEVDFNIKLPDNYVYFLTEIGNGGAGPYYGLYSLEELRQRQYCRQQDNKLNPVIDISLSKKMWNELMEQRDTADDDVYDEIDQRINTGVFSIGTQGCTYDNLLMFRGSETGKIVYIDWNLESEYPLF